MTVWVAAALVAIAVAGGPRLRPIRRLGARAATPAPAWRWPVLAAAAGSLLVALGVTPVLVVALGGAAGLVALARGRTARGRLVAGRRRSVVELTFAIAAELRAGRTVAEALHAAAAVDLPAGGAVPDPALGSTFAEAAGAAAHGGSAARVLRDAASLPGAERLRHLAAALQVTESAGARVGAVLEGLGVAMDHDEELRQELDAALAGPRASMVMLAVLPILGLLLGQAMGADPFALLVHRPLGWGLLGAGAGLDLAGLALVRLITRWVLRC